MNIGFIGCGNMSRSIISGMLRGDFTSDSIMVNDISTEAMSLFETEFGVLGVKVFKLCSKCEIIILAVKPQNITELASQTKDFLASSVVLVSILAGISTTKLEELFNINNIIRVMPNTAAMVGNSASALYTTSTRNTIVEGIFKNIGVALWVKNESDIDIVTALSGSGPAYFYTFFEAMIATAIDMGLSDSIARELCIQTAIGAGILAQHSGEEISTLRAQVTSKGGITEAALESFADANISQIIHNAMYKALERGKELNQDSY